MKILSFLILTLFLFSCCGSRKSTTTKEAVKEKQTETVKYIVRDTAIYIPGDTVVMEQVIPCPDVKWQAKATGNKTTVKAEINNGKLKVECHTDSLNQRIQYLEKQVENRKEVVRTVEKTLTRRYIPKIVYWIWLAELAIAGYVFRKPLLKLMGV